MTDQKRPENEPNRGQQGSQPHQTSPSQDDQMDQGVGSTSGNRFGRDSADTAEDRGMERERRNAGDRRQGDRLESETDGNRALDEADDTDEELGAPGNSDR